MIHETTVECPYCGEPFDTVIDASAGDQRYVEDCFVCCRPIEFHVTVGADGEPAAIEVWRDDD